MSHPDRTGVLLINLGTPDRPTPGAVRRYLREFLSDRRVVDLNRALWLPILHLFILPFRPRRVAHAYQQIWTEDGSPLLAVSKRQTIALEQKLTDEGLDVPVRLGMVYGNPSIVSAMRQLRDLHCNRIVALPLYPQYSTATVGSASDAIARATRWTHEHTHAHVHEPDLPPAELAETYHDHPSYITALAASIQRFWEHHGEPQHLLMSFHGVPQRYVDNGDPYEKHCRATARLLADELTLADDRWTLTFQSRFGREPWLQPYTDVTLQAWGKEGRQNIDVVCPGFSADCLETLEEIALQNRDIFEDAGGDHFRYIPALNDNPEHIDMMAALLRPLLPSSN